jgi:hypothetical protein
LREQDLPPDRLTLEVTENSVMQQFNRVMSVLECLLDVGVRISLDDFGTGQSSLAQLRNRTKRSCAPPSSSRTAWGWKSSPRASKTRRRL